MTAPGAGGLVDSRDFVDLRCWQIIKNGNIIHRTDVIDNEMEIAENSSNTLEHRLSSISEIQLTENQFRRSAFKQSFYSLSMCLGAKIFDDDECHPMTSELWSRRKSSDCDLFVDASECECYDGQSFNYSSNRSEEVEQIVNNANDSCDTMYIVSSVSIKYDQMPPIPKYTR